MLEGIHYLRKIHQWTVFVGSEGSEDTLSVQNDQEYAAYKDTNLTEAQ